MKACKYLVSSHLRMGVFGHSSPRLGNSNIEMTTQTVFAFPKNTRKLRLPRWTLVALWAFAALFTAVACSSDGILYPVFAEPTDNNTGVGIDTSSESETQTSPKDSDTGEPPGSDTGEPPASDSETPSDPDNNFCEAPYSCISEDFCSGINKRPFICENPRAACCDLAWCDMFEDNVCAQPMTDECLGRVAWIGNKCDDPDRICCVPGVLPNGDTFSCKGPGTPVENSCVESPEACKNSGGTPHSARCDPMKDGGNTCCYHHL